MYRRCACGYVEFVVLSATSHCLYTENTETRNPHRACLPFADFVIRIRPRAAAAVLPVIRIGSTICETKFGILSCARCELAVYRATPPHSGHVMAEAAISNRLPKLHRESETLAETSFPDVFEYCEWLVKAPELKRRMISNLILGFVQNTSAGHKGTE